MSNFDYSDPIITRRRKGDLSDPFISFNEPLTIDTHTYKVVLTEIPDKLSRVQVNGLSITWVEVQQGLPTANQFYVDYIGRTVTFHSSRGGTQLSFQYMGTGLHFIPDSSVYTQQSGGNVTQTLADIITEGNIAITNLSQVNQAITNANAATSAANTAASSATASASTANTAKTNADTATGNANSAASSANTAASAATTAKNNADLATTSANNAATAANTAKTNADTATVGANNAASSANSAATSATTAATNATNAATTANTAASNADVKASLADTAATNANSKATLADTAATNATNSANAANTSKTNADTATANANTATSSANAATTSATTAASNATTAATNAQAVADNTKGFGVYNSATTYKSNNFVTLNGSSYMALVQVVGVTPGTDPTKWQSMATKGTDGTGSGTVVNVISTNADIAITNGSSTPDLAISSTLKSTWNGKQNALGFTPENIASKGVAGGYADLDGSAKLPIARLPDAILGQVQYQGTWNANTNTPTLPTASTTKGYYYVVSVAGVFNTIDFKIGDWVISNGTIWDKVDNTDAVPTVFGRTGNVIANINDYTWAQIDKTTSSLADLTTRNLSDLTQSASFRTVTDTEKSIWNAKQDTITGAASSIASSNLTINRALASDGTGKVAVSSVTSTELGYVSGVTGAIQTQFSGKANLSGAAFTGPNSYSRNLLTQPQLKDYSETLSTNATTTGAITLDIANGNVFDNTLTGATTLTFSNPAASGQACSFTLLLRQGATAQTVAWPASVVWNGGTAPDLTNVSKTTILTFMTVNGGTRWYGFVGGNNFVT